ncbi:MAG: hypothetical protein QOD98_468, partial [Nocardioidaceae bacterium]|nr:hypothetical protein [Nocardioidaceae bacterium]
DDIEALVDDVRRSGLDVELVRSGKADDADAATSLAAYRIVQESLTNVIKHSAAQTAQVTVAATPTAVDIDVTDPGPARMSSGSSSGHGLLGLDERVRLVGGVLESGADHDGFRVHAVLPTGTHK